MSNPPPFPPGFQPERIDTREDPPNPLLWPVLLLFLPRRFFRHFITRHHALVTVLAVYVIGVAAVIDRIESRAMAGAAPPGVMSSCDAFWTAALGIGVIGGLMIYAILGWWYRLRLRWSGAVDPDPYVSRRVFVYAGLIKSLPVVLMSVYEMTQAPSPAASYGNASFWYFLLLIFPFWSVAASFIGVITVFPEVGRIRAAIFFIVLPALLYGFAIVAILFAVVFVGMPGEEPDLNNTRRHDAGVVQFQFPGNWYIGDTDPNYDPDVSVTAYPPQDAYVSVTTYLGYDTLDVELQDSEDMLTAEFGPATRLAEFSTYGGYSGVGRVIRLPGDGLRGDFHARLFISTIDPSTEFRLEIQELYMERDQSRIRPGYDLIERTLNIASW